MICGFKYPLGPNNVHFGNNNLVAESKRHEDMKMNGKSSDSCEGWFQMSQNQSDSMSAVG